MKAMLTDLRSVLCRSLLLLTSCYIKYSGLHGLLQALGKGKQRKCALLLLISDMMISCQLQVAYAPIPGTFVIITSAGCLLKMNISKLLSDNWPRDCR